MTISMPDGNGGPWWKVATIILSLGAVVGGATINRLMSHGEDIATLKANYGSVSSQLNRMEGALQRCEGNQEAVLRQLADLLERKK